MSYRPFVTALIIFSIIFLPYWVYLPVLLGAIIVFPLYWEALVASLLVDFLYGSGVPLWPIGFSTSLCVLVALIILMPLRDRIRIHV